MALHIIFLIAVSMLRLLRSTRAFSSKAVNWSQPTSHHTYYEVLGVDTSATDEQIKDAYRKLVELYHPGVATKGDPKKFQSISEAYVILSNDHTKRAYDLLQKEAHNKTFLGASEKHQRQQADKTSYEKEQE